MTALSQLTKVFRIFALITVSMAIGTVSSVVLLYVSIFLFAGANGDAWASWVFAGDGYRFTLAAMLLGAAAYPLVKRAKLKLV